MTFALRWPVLCVWLHTSDSCSSSSVDSSRRSVGIVCLGGSGKHGKQPLPFRRAMRMQIDALGESSQNAGAEDEIAQKLNAFSLSRGCKDGGSVTVQALKPQQLKGTVEVLTDSFCDLLWGPLTYRPLLKMIVQENLRESQRLFPKNAVLVAMYSGNSSSESKSKKVLAGTVEVHLVRRDEEETPYLCNMAVKQNYRRRGIGRELLKSAEELALAMGSNKMHLHCRLIDKVPLEMYKRAGYKVVSTSSFLSLLRLERRKHLMRKLLDADS